MHTLMQYNRYIPALFFLSLLWSGNAFGQGSSIGQQSVGGFLGFTDRDDIDFTFGGEYSYRLRRQWSVGGVIEYTPDVIRGLDATLVMGTADFHPQSMPRLKVTGGAGVEFKDFGGDNFRFRIGAGYDVFKEGSITVTPRISVDFGEGDESVVFGATVSYNLP